MPAAAAAQQDLLSVGGPEPSGAPSAAQVRDQQVEEGPVVLVVHVAVDGIDVVFLDVVHDL